MENERLTIKKIAELTGVSTATVSKVLNNTGRYSNETRKKILDVVEKYDYRPNAVAKSLRTSKSKTIGVIVPDITNEFFAHIVLAIERYCGPIGYSIFICNSDENEEKEIQYLKELENKGVDGLIYLAASNQLIEARTNLPIVCIDRKPNLENTMIISSDNIHGGYLATLELIKHGCENILLLRDFRDVLPTVERSIGFHNALKEHGIDVKENQVALLEVGIEQGKEAIHSLIKNNKFEFDGIFATTDGLAYGAYLALKENRISVPDQVKIVGYDNISLARYNSISSIDQNKQLLGELAAENLLLLIEKKTPRQHNTIKIPVELVRRGSTSKG
ncbi:LacI family DNA-binding transcriptional regulator [Robertmurraya sp. FSL R5-0851]|uniref:LacI family DNA-binding transcriptional regulator n=1 Tax=Robertmurraya sp. FSL R5-0851 TaxID=2921584 RepID=UPI0030F648AD